MDLVRKMVTPSLYLQGRGAVDHLGPRALPYGNRAFVIGGSTALSVVGDRVRKSLESNGIEVSLWESGVSECTWGTVNRLVEAGRKAAPHFVVGVGGGKAVDTAKIVAWKLKVPSVVVGTQCATNADTSAEAVVYTEDHRFVEWLVLSRNPVLVIEDTDVLAKAPAKFLVWGMGDALSTKFEGEAYAKARLKKKDGGVPTTAALALADGCYKVLMEHGLKALHDVQSGVHSRDVDDVIDAIAAAGYNGVVVVPLGFATDHLETLYDLDIVTAGRARAAGLAFERSAAPNADPQLAAELAAAIVANTAADRT